jgi:hypothetical protein
MTHIPLILLPRTGLKLWQKTPHRREQLMLPLALTQCSLLFMVGPLEAALYLQTRYQGDNSFFFY